MTVKCCADIFFLHISAFVTSTHNFIPWYPSHRNYYISSIFFKLNTICLSFHTREAHQSPIFSLLVPIPFLGVVHNPTSSKKWGIASDHQCSVDATPGHFCPWACIALSQILTWSLRFLDQVSLQDNLSRILCWVTWYLASLDTHTP